LNIAAAAAVDFADDASDALSYMPMPPSPCSEVFLDTLIFSFTPLRQRAPAAYASGMLIYAPCHDARVPQR